ncbi:MAG: hypothetical protein AAGE59_31385 [Cyanobacteria bacterium P01_F01_bin.86]
MEENERQQQSNNASRFAWGRLKPENSTLSEQLDIEHLSINQQRNDHELFPEPSKRPVKKTKQPTDCKIIYSEVAANYSETWVVKWFALPVAYLFPKSDREEWIGDLREMQYELIVENRYPKWVVSAITIMRTFLLVGAAIEIKVLMLVSHIRGIS